MPLPALARVERRRLRYWRRRAAAVTLIGLLAAGGVLASKLRSADPPAKAAKPTADSPPATAAVPTSTVEVTPAGPTEGPALLVREGPLASQAFTPPLGAGGAILVDGTTGTVLWGRYPHARLPIASTTKIMTAVLVLEHLRLDDEVVIRRGIRLIEPFREGLRPGERIPVRKLLYGLLLFSGNDDAVALGRSRDWARTIVRWQEDPAQSGYPDSPSEERSRRRGGIVRRLRAFSAMPPPRR